MPVASGSHRLGLQTRLADSRDSLLGDLLYRAALGRVRREFNAALALPDSLERDARVKHSYFVVRMLPALSLRAMAMASAGALPYGVAVGLGELASGHPLRGLRSIVGAYLPRRAGRRSSPGSS